MSFLEDVNCPVFYAEGQQRFDVKTWRLRVRGEVAQEKGFSFQDILKMPYASVNARLTSVSGWSVRADWGGVFFSDFLESVTLKEKAKFVDFLSLGGYDSCLPLAEVLKPGVVLCYKVNGQDLPKKYGAPLRLIVPHLWGYKSVKGLGAIEFLSQEKLGYWEQRGYPQDARIEPGMTIDINSKQRREIKGGEVVDF